MPHKFTAYTYCTTSSERSRLLEVVSVMRRNADGSWHGDMLDGLAFVKAQRDQGAQPEGARVLLVGAGPPDPTGCDLVCNATPLGMAEGDPLPVAADLLAPTMFVGDVIAGHGETPLLSAARAAGCKTANGDQMVEAVQETMLDFMLGK